MDEGAARATGDAAFRREAAHALSTPLGSLLLQAELIEHYLGQGKVAQAREAVATLLRDFEAYGRRFRSMFAAMEDIAEDGPSGADPRACLAEAVSEWEPVPPRFDCRGPSPRVALPARALLALFRRLVTVAAACDANAVIAVRAVEEGGQYRLTLSVGDGAAQPGVESLLHTARGLDFRVAVEIAARHGGSLTAGAIPGQLAVLALPLEPD